MNYPCELVNWQRGGWKSEQVFDSLDQALAYIGKRFPQGYASWRRTWGGWVLPIYAEYVPDGHSSYALRMTEENFILMMEGIDRAEGWA